SGPPWLATLQILVVIGFFSRRVGCGLGLGVGSGGLRARRSQLLQVGPWKLRRTGSCCVRVLSHAYLVQRYGNARTFGAWAALCQTFFAFLMQAAVKKGELSKTN